MLETDTNTFNNNFKNLCHQVNYNLVTKECFLAQNVFGKI